MHVKARQRLLYQSVMLIIGLFKEEAALTEGEASKGALI